MIKGGKRIILMPWRQFQTSSPMAIFCGHFVYGLNLCSYLPMWFKLLYEKTIADRNIKFNALKIQLSPKLNVISDAHICLLLFFVYLFQIRTLIGSHQDIINLIGKLK